MSRNQDNVMNIGLNNQLIKFILHNHGIQLSLVTLWPKKLLWSLKNKTKL